MNRHLVVVEVDKGLFHSASDAAMFIERAVAAALQRDALQFLGGRVDLRPAVSCMANDAPCRFVDGEGLDVSRENEFDAAHLGVQSNATLIEELSHRAELGDTDRGLDYRPRVTI